MALAEVTRDRIAAGQSLATILANRRSIRQLRAGPLPMEALTRIAEAARLAPAAYNRPPWHVVVIRERQAAFWALVEAAFRERLEGDRLARYLDRLAGFRGGVATVLVYEDRAVLDELPDAWGIDRAQAQAFSDQALGMVQYALWLAIVAEGLATSVQHWEPLIEDRLAAFLDVPADRYRLVASMPLGYPAEEPRDVERPALHHVISFDAFARGIDSAADAL